ncbi:hypothetical protein [Gordoniibacillus kamchatkensis]|uniref:hypothetical protein n=1 Tax=Gordoniibacillus kamchatkensis TaxID=1590651 RepID=UPI0012E0A825|nr:hypothetical protein [Paenibacillus sp. VKM B-2647]
MENFQNPTFIKWIIFGKINYFWRIPWVENGSIAHFFEKIRNPMHIILVIVGWSGIIVSIIKRKKVQLISLIILYYFFLHQVFLAIPRYAFPIMPFIILMSSFTIKEVVEGGKAIWSKYYIKATQS